MIDDNFFETDGVKLAAHENENDESEVRIARSGNAIATGSFTPEEVETAPEANDPEIVNGYLDQIESAQIDTDSGLVDKGDDDDLFQSEVVIGPDDRKRVTPTNRWPWSVHGHMRMRFPNGKTYIGTGTVVNRHHVLTAGHCIYSKRDGGWATSVSFEAARDDGARPFGTQFATRLLSVKGWTQNGLTEYDMGMLILSTDIGNRTGWKGIITGPDSLLHRYRVNVTGYPGDKGGTTMWTHADAISSVASERFYYMIDTAGGQSGSGVWSKWRGHQGEKVCGIHTTGSQNGNGATRISRPKFDRIVDWMSRY